MATSASLLDSSWRARGEVVVPRYRSSRVSSISLPCAGWRDALPWPRTPLYGGCSGATSKAQRGSARKCRTILALLCVAHQRLPLRSTNQRERTNGQPDSVTAASLNGIRVCSRYRATSGLIRGSDRSSVIACSIARAGVAPGIKRPAGFHSTLSWRARPQTTHEYRRVVASQAGETVPDCRT